MATVEEFNETAAELESLARALGIKALAASEGDDPDGPTLTIFFDVEGVNPVVFDSLDE